MCVYALRLDLGYRKFQFKAWKNQRLLYGPMDLYRCIASKHSLDISRSWCHLVSLGVTSASKPLVCIVALCSWDPLGYALVVPWLSGDE